jgi:cytochrome P450
MIDIGLDDPEIRKFHYWNPEVQHDPDPLLARMRATCPVAWSEAYGGFWVFTKYDDVYRAFQDTEVFSSFPGHVPAGGMGKDRPSIPVETDPPDHTRYREILAPLFTLHRMRRLEDRIRTHVRDLIAGISRRGRCDYAVEYAKVLPTQVFLELMGWPLSDAPMFLKWTEILMRNPTEDLEAALAAKQHTAGELWNHFAAELARRDEIGAPPRGAERTGDAVDRIDFIDWLRGASFGGDRPLNQTEMLDCIFIVMLAGLDTTQAVLSFGTEHLARHPEEQRALRDEPEVIPDAVEEMLRAFAPVFSGRRMLCDVEMRGVTLRESDTVVLAMGSACRDEEHFVNPDVVDLRRKPNRHIAFGVGAHRCLGSHLARMVLRISLQEWHQQIPDYSIDPARPVRRHLTAVRGVDSLPLLIGVAGDG